MNVSEQIASMISSQGVDTVFALAGEAHMRVLTAVEAAGLQIIGTHSENGCVGAADGYARFTGAVGVALLNSGHGLPNAVAAILTAHEAATPLVVLAAGPPKGAKTAPAAVSAAAVGTVAGICKGMLRVFDPASVHEGLTAAFELAATGRPGPVVVELTTDILSEPAVTPTNPATTSAKRQSSSLEAELGVAATLLSECSKVVVVVGPESRWSKDPDGIRELCRTHNLVALGETLGRGVVPEDLVLGYPIRLVVDLCAEADAVLLLGAEAGTSVGLGSPRFFAPDARVVRISDDDVSPFELCSPDLTVTADCGEAARILSRKMSELGFTSSPDFRETVEISTAARVDSLKMAAADASEPVAPGLIPKLIDELVPADTVFISDGAVIYSWAHGLLRVQSAPGWLDHAPYGSMGIGTPLAIGVAAGARDVARRTGGKARRVVLITGDGAAGYFTSEWGTAAQYGLAITVVISNDSGWGTERLEQIQTLGRAVNVDFNDIRYDLVAEGFGCRGVRAKSPLELEHAIEEAIECETPFVIDVVTEGKGPRPEMPRFFPGGRHKMVEK